MAKIDLKSAYRSVHLHPSQTGFKWKFKNNDHFTYLYDTALPFGSRKSLSQSVRRKMKRRGYDIVVYKYPGWLPLLGGQSVPEGSRNPVVCV